MPRSTGPDTVIRRGAIMIIDQAGFTRSVLERGAAYALRRIWRMRTTLVPLLREHHGEIFKVDADNLYCFFRGVEDALRAAIAAHRALARGRRVLTNPLQVSIGIGYGDLHYVTSEDDYYGAEVNLASKLGEDVACGGETLLTEAALAAIREPVEGRAGRRRYALVSKLRIPFRAWSE